MSSPEDIARPSSPSTCVSDVSRISRKSKESSYKEVCVKKTKETQVSAEDLTSAIMYQRNANELRCDVSNLPPLEFNQPGPSDPRNAALARLVAFELDRVPEEKRSVTYVYILNVIRKVRQQKVLDDISLPSYEESDQSE